MHTISLPKRIVLPAVGLACILGVMMVHNNLGERNSVVPAIPSAFTRTEQKSNAPTARFIAAAMKHQASAVIKAKWQLAGDMHYDYIRTPDTLWVKETDPKSGYTARISYDRAANETRTSSKSKGSEVYRRIERSSMGDLFSDYDMVDGVFLVLWDAATTAQPLYETIALGHVMPAQQDVDGHQCWRVELKPEGGNDNYVIWVDQNIGFWPRRIEVIAKSGTRSPLVVSYYEFKELSKGIWFPGKQFIQLSEKLRGRDLSDISSNSKGWSVGTKQGSKDAPPWASMSVKQVTEAHAGGSVPKDSLIVKFPKGSEYYLNFSNDPLIAK